MAETKHRRKIHHDKFLARIVFWLSQTETLVWFSLAFVFLLLTLLSLYYRPAEVSQFIANAQTAYKNGNYESSYNFLSKAVLLDNTNPQIHYELSRVYQATNNWEGAKKELLLGLEISPDSSMILKELNKVQKTLQEPKRVEEELSFWKKELANKPDYRDGWIQLSVRYYELYQIEDAKLALQKAYQLDPNFETTKKLREIIK